MRQEWKRAASLRPHLAGFWPALALGSALLLCLALGLALLDSSGLRASGAGPRSAGLGLWRRLRHGGPSSGGAPASDAARGKPVPLLRQGEVPEGCIHLEHVCVDQGNVVMMDPSFSAVGPHQQRPLPSFDPDLRYNFPTPGCSSDAYVDNSLKIPPIAFRPLSSREASPDLLHPAFEEAVLPLLLVPTWADNYGHMLGNSATWLFDRLHARNASWAAQAALVVHTPHGFALRPFWQPLVGPLVPAHPIRTLAELSNRPAAGCKAAAGALGRCFLQMVVCAAFKDTDSVNISQTAHYIARQYAPATPPPRVEYKSSTAAGAACASGGVPTDPLNQTAALPGNGSTSCRRVLFLTRPSQPVVRQLLNQEELLERCRGWAYTDPATNVTFGLACGQYEPAGDLPANIAAMESADVIVGMHGATMANAFFARPGTAMLEVFTGGWTWQVHRLWMDGERDPGRQMQWWALFVQDPAALTPGELEASLGSHPQLYRGWQGGAKTERDRNLRLPWPALEQALQEYAATQAAGGMPAYRRRRQEGRQPVAWFVREGGEIAPAGTCASACPFESKP